MSTPCGFASGAQFLSKSNLHSRSVIWFSMASASVIGGHYMPPKPPKVIKAVLASDRLARLHFATEARDFFLSKSLVRFQSPVIWGWTPTSLATQQQGDVAGSMESITSFRSSIQAFCTSATSATPIRQLLKIHTALNCDEPSP